MLDWMLKWTEKAIAGIIMWMTDENENFGKTCGEDIETMLKEKSQAILQICRFQVDWNLGKSDKS